MDKVLENRIYLLIREMTLEDPRCGSVSHRGGGKTSYSPFKDVRWTDGCAQRVCQ